MSETRLAWHFVGETLRDGQPVPANGEWLEHEGELVMCAAGLHASTHVGDALEYAPGNILCRVRLGGKIIEGADKMVGSRRKIIWRVDAAPVLRAFGRWCALRVLHLWEAPDVVIRYLRTGNEDMRAAARDAAWAAARDAASDAAWAAAWDARSTQLVKMIREARAGKTEWVFEEQADE